MAESIGNSGTGMKLHTKILLALCIGATAGILANTQLGKEDATVGFVNTYLAGPIGQIFLRMLFMVVMPLVFSSIALGVAGLGDLRKVGQVGGKAIGYFLGTTFIAAAFGLLAVSVVRPGDAVPDAVKTELMTTYAGDAATKIEAGQQGGFGINTFVEIVTRNPVKSAADFDMLGVIFFGLMFGAALTQMLARIGLEVQAAGQPAAVIFPARQRGELSNIMAGWGTLTGESNYYYAANAHTNNAQLRLGAFNWTGFSDAEIDKLVQDASVALDDKAREALLQKIGALWNEKRVVIPLAAVGSAWAVRRDRATLRVGRSDEETYAWDVVPVAR